MSRSLLFINFLLVFFSVFKLQAQTNQVVSNGQATAVVDFPGGGCVYNWVNNKPSIGLAGSGAGNIASFRAVNTGNAPVTATITATPAAGVFAYVLSSTGLMVVNTTTNAIAANIGVGADPVGVTVTADGSMAYVTNLVDGTVSVVSAATNTVTATIPVGKQPYGIVVSRDGSRVYVANSASSSVSVINTATNKVIKTVAVGLNPVGIAISPDGKLVYISNLNSSSISVLNTVSNTIVATIAVSAAPYGIACSPDGSKVYVVNSANNAVSVINTANNGVIATVPVGQGPLGVAVSTDGSRVYVTNQNSGTVSVIDASTNRVIETIPVGDGPGGISVSPDGSLVYAGLNTQNNSVVILSTLTNQVTAKLDIGTSVLSFGNFIVGRTSGCPPVTFTVTVNPIALPSITASAATGTISACAGSPSISPNIQQFPISGSDLTTDITATAPLNFEVSLSSAAGYGNSVTIPQTNGTVSNTIVYVRSAANAPAGNISGNVVLTSTGATSQNVPVTGIINALPVVNAVANQAVANGSNTTAVNFTGTGNNFSWVNDTPAIGLAVSGTGDIASFKAINKSSDVVKATITVTPLSVGYAYIANFADDNVSVINTTTNKVAMTIPVGTEPWSVSLSPDEKKVYVTNAGSGNVSVINTSNNKVVATISVGDTPQMARVSADGSTLYVANFISNTISVINTANNQVESTISVGNNPGGLAISSDGKTLYVANIGSRDISVVNTATNSVTTTISTGLNSSVFQLLLSADGKRLYVANGKISVIDTQTNTVVENISAGSAPFSMCLSSDGSKLYAVNSGSNDVSVINTLNDQVISTINVGLQPEGISIDPDGGNVYVTNHNSNTVSVINTANNVVVATIPVGRYPVSEGNFISKGTHCSGAPITFTITVNPTLNSTMSAAGSLSPLSTVYGKPSTSESFQVSGSNLTSGILVTPPAGFEVSADNATFSKTTVIGAAGNINATNVYIRLAATTPVANAYSGNIVLSSTNVTDVDVFIPNSTVTPALLTVTPDNKSKAYGDANPVLTATYSGFVNNETIAQLSVLPTIETPATTQSPVGSYPITAYGAIAGNYQFLYNTGVLTIIGKPLIPNVFTPNNDGHNDTWNIQYLDAYPNCLVNVYDRYGQNVLTSHGYSNPWNGTSGNTALPAGTYYYVINLNNGQSVLSGYVLIAR